MYKQLGYKPVQPPNADNAFYSYVFPYLVNPILCLSLILLRDQKLSNNGQFFASLFYLQPFASKKRMSCFWPVPSP